VVPFVITIDAAIGHDDAAVLCEHFWIGIRPGSGAGRCAGCRIGGLCSDCRRIRGPSLVTEDWTRGCFFLQGQSWRQRAARGQLNRHGGYKHGVHCVRCLHRPCRCLCPGCGSPGLAGHRCRLDCRQVMRNVSITIGHESQITTDAAVLCRPSQRPAIVVRRLTLGLPPSAGPSLWWAPGWPPAGAQK
jgi:hypothetical protein